MILYSGIIAYLCGTVFIDRRNLKETTQKINSVGKTLTPDQVKLWVFPEGTRNRDKKLSLLTFKKGAFHVAQTSGLPILPLGRIICLAGWTFKLYENVFQFSLNTVFWMSTPACLKSVRVSSMCFPWSPQKERASINCLRKQGRLWWVRSLCETLLSSLEYPRSIVVNTQINEMWCYCQCPETVYCFIRDVYFCFLLGWYLQFQ